MYFYASNLGPLWRGHLGPCGHDLNNLGKRLLGKLCIKFQACEPSGSEEGFLIFFMYFYGSSLGLPGRDQLEPWDLCLNKFGKGPPGNATYQT